VHHRDVLQQVVQ